MTRRGEDRKRENWLAAFISLLGAVFMIILFLLVFWEAQEGQEQSQSRERAEEAPEDLIIEKTDPCNNGSIVIYANGGVYAFYGSFDIENDGRNGKEIYMTLEGYMEAGYPHGEPAAEIYGP